MNHYLLKISYKGSRFYGWQKQPNVRTIQGELERVLKKLTKSDHVFTMGSGRTDAGVHAQAQMVKVSLDKELPLQGLIHGVNSLIDSDIRVLDSKNVEESFHPVRDAIEKEYHYIIAKSRPSVFTQDFVSYFHPEIDFEKLSIFAKVFEGEYDFCNYMCQGTDVSTTVRTIFSSKVEIVKNIYPWLDEDEFYVYKVVGNGFLKQMVRNLVGSLVDIAKSGSKMPPIKSLLLAKDRRQAGICAPASGLSLVRVVYGEPIRLDELILRANSGFSFEL